MFEVDSHGKTNWKNFQEAENVYLRHFLGIWGSAAPTSRMLDSGMGVAFQLHPKGLVGSLVKVAFTIPSVVSGLKPMKY